ncbi:hypothetical protein [Litoreibacter janthinus]|uniref:Uncharacterized protein n=1 Tax=Litoreibacter janthinus TaxID=670154 RepID=A0A1I6H5G2_9RHOB|nr:hypothetical protein [Litoreibacter janthinus]SFR49644.1 hypothetical protein SAMN04488002_2543 [Litoreibacter janthinus]
MNYVVGQVWTFPETEDRPQLIVTIGRIDTAAELGADPANSAVLSVSVTPNEEARKLDWPQVAHAPIAETAFNADGSGELVMDGVSPPDDFASGYATWRETFDAGNAGVFTVGPSEAYAAILEIYAETD